jgi:type IV secretion system protein TrbE
MPTRALPMQDLRDPQGDELCNYLDWSHLVGLDPAVMLTKTGRLQMSVAARTLDTEQMTAAERRWYLARLDEVLKLLEPGWAIEFDWWHEPTTAYLATDWDATGAPAVDRFVDGLRRVDVEDRPRHHAQLWLTLSWQPPSPMRQLFQDLLLTKKRERVVRAALGEEVQRYQDGAQRFAGYLTPLLDAYAPLAPELLATYLHRTVSWDTHAVTDLASVQDLDWQLTSDRFEPGRPPWLGNRLRGLFVQPLTVKTWQPSLGTYLPEALSVLPFPCRAVTRWAPLSLQAADHYLTWEERRRRGQYSGLTKMLRGMTGGADDTEVTGRDEQDSHVAAGQSLIDIRRAVRRGEAVLGMLGVTVLAWGETVDVLDTRLKALSEAMFRQGLVVRIEEANASIEWLATIPGHVRYGLRAKPLDTRKLTGLMPHTHRWSGPARDDYLDDEPLLQVTSDGTPFNLVTHPTGNLGGVFIFGPSQMGKSGLQGLMNSQSARYGRHGRRRKLALFDLDNAHKCFTLLRGGGHYALGAPGCVPLQILGDLATPDHQEWAALQLEQILMGEGLPPTPEERRALLKAVRLVAGLPMPQRTMSMVQRMLQVDRLKVGLAPFCAGGEYAFCDGSSSALAWDKDILCFEMRALLGKPRAMNPVLAYVFHELRVRWFTGAPVEIVLEEAKWLAEIQAMLGEISAYLKTCAKLNVSVRLVCQEIYDLAATPLWQAVLADIPTRICLPNPMCLSPRVQPYYEELLVSERSLQRLSVAQPFRDYLYVSPLGQRLFQCHLSPVERLLCAASSLEEQAVIDDMVQVCSPEELPAAWLDYWGFSAEAALLAPRAARPTEGAPICADDFSSSYVGS